MFTQIIQNIKKLIGNTFAYLDNSLIMIVDYNENFKKIEEILKVLKTNNILINYDKSQVALESIKFLSLIIEKRKYNAD